MTTDAPGPTETIRVTLEGAVYVLQPWKTDDGRRWLFRLLKMVAEGGLAVGDTVNVQAQIGGMLSAIDEASFEALWLVCQSYTGLVGSDDKGETVVALSSVAAAQLRGRYLTMAGLIAAHLRRQYAGFFVGLPAMMRDLGIGPAETAKSQ